MFARLFASAFAILIAASQVISASEATDLFPPEDSVETTAIQFDAPFGIDFD